MGYPRMPSLHLTLLCITSQIILMASLGHTTRANADLEICPGVMDCTHEAVDVLISFTDVPESHVSRVRNLSECQNFCGKAKHTYYRYMPRSYPKKGLCYCFNACESLVIGSSTVGLVSACRASAEVALKAQQLEELQEWDLPLQGALSSSSSSSSSASSSASSSSSSTSAAAEAAAAEALVVAEQQKMEKGRMEGGGMELMRMQQRVQLRSQKSVGWQVLQKTQELLHSAQVLFLEKEQQQREKQLKEQQQKEKKTKSDATKKGEKEGQVVSVHVSLSENDEKKPTREGKVASMDLRKTAVASTEPHKAAVVSSDPQKAAAAGEPRIVSSKMELDELAEHRVAALLSQNTELKGHSAVLSKAETMEEQDRLVRQLMDE